MARLGWFCPVVSEPVKPYFTRFLRVLTFCRGVSKIVILKENGVVNGVVKDLYNKYDFESVNDIWIKDILLNNKNIVPILTILSLDTTI